jgi:hypothetical protein
MNGGRNVTGTQYPPAPFCHGPHQVQLVVDFVEGASVFADHCAIDLAGQKQNRR